MVSFTYDPNPTSDPNYTSLSRGTDKPEVNQSGTALISGISNSFDIGVKGIDTAIKTDIDDSLRSKVKNINAQFGVDEATRLAAQGVNATGVRGDSSSPLSILQGAEGGAGGGLVGDKGGHGAPAGVAKLGQRIQTIQDAYDAGMMSNSMYNAQLQIAVQAESSKYGGAYDKEIQDSIHSITGIKPAEALRSSLLADLDYKARAANSSGQAELKEIHTDAKYLWPSAMEDYATGKTSIWQIREISSLRKQAEFNRAEKLATLNGTIEEKQLKVGPLIAQDLSQSVFQNTNNLTMNPGAKATMDKMAAGQPITNEEHNGLLETMRQLRAKTERDIDLKINGINPDDGTSMRDADGHSYASIYANKPEQLAALRKGALTPLDNIEKAIGEKDYSLAARQATLYQGMEQSRTLAIAKQFPMALNSAAITKMMGPNAVPWILAESTKDGLLPQYLRTSRDMMMFDTFSNSTPPAMKTQVEKAYQSGQFQVPRDKAQFLVSSTNKAVEGVLSDDPRVAQQSAKTLFHPDNIGFLTLYAQKDWGNVYGSLTSQKVTDRMVQLGQEDPTLFRNYRVWASESAKPLMMFQAKDLQRQMETDTRGTLALVPDTQELIYKPEPLTGKLQRRNDTSEAAVRQKVENINQTIRRLKPIWEAGGDDVPANVQDLLTASGMNVEKEKPKPRSDNAAPEVDPNRALSFASNAPSLTDFLKNPSGTQEPEPPDLAPHQTRGVIRGNLSDEDLLSVSPSQTYNGPGPMRGRP